MEHTATLRDIPAPSSGRIRRIVHIADLHIRAGESDKARYEEYRAVFENLICALYQRRDLPRDATATVICGDVFHDKNTISPCGVMLFDLLIEGLSKLGPVYVLRGNHDFRQDIVDAREPDLLRALLQQPGRAEGVVYLDETGTYVAGDVGFGVLAIQDVLQLGGSSGVASEVPEFPRPLTKAAVRHRIALFHGSVQGCRMQNGTIAGGGADPRRWFDGYDAALLGDIHLQQVHHAQALECLEQSGGTATVTARFRFDREGRERQCCCYAYPGSLVQQNFGESVAGHGALLWDLETDEVDVLHVHNPYGFVTVDGGDPLCVVHAGQRRGSLPLVQTAQLPWFPKTVRVRKLARAADSPGDDDDRVRDILLTAGLTVQDAVHDCPASVVMLTGRSDGDESSSLIAQPPLQDQVEHLNSPDAWIEYVRARLAKPDEEEEWLGFFKNLETLAVPVPDPGLLGTGTCDKVSERNRKILRGATDVRAKMDAAPRPGILRLRSMEWAWMLCYKDECRFDFDLLDGHVAVLAGGNATGKTAFLEILMYALFGEGFPSRSSCSTAMVNTQRPPNKKAYVSLTFELGDKTYWLHRSLELETTTSAGERKLTNRDARILRVRANGEEVMEATGKVRVDKWVNERLGPPSSFLHGCMLTQHNDSDFFALSARDQMSMLDVVMNMDAVAAVVGVLREAKLAHVATADAMSAAADSLGAMLEGPGSEATTTEELEAAVGELQERVDRLQRARRPCASPADIAEVQQARAWLREDKDGAGEEATEAEAEAELRGRLTEAESIAAQLRRHAAGPPARPRPAQVDAASGDHTAPREMVELATRRAHREDAIKCRMEQEIDRFRRLKASSETMPFNRDCPACNQQPWRRQLKDIKAEVGRLRDELAAHAAETATVLRGRSLQQWRDALEAAAAAEEWDRWDRFREAEAEARRLRRSIALRVLARHPQDEDAERAARKAEEEELRAATDELTRARELAWQARRQEKTRERRDALRGALVAMRRRAQLLTRLHQVMEGYRSWAYEERLMPALVERVNGIMAAVCEDRVLSLRSTWKTHKNERLPSWQLVDGKRSAPLDKSSGFQRFIVSFSARVALTALGACGGVRCAQLFVDEGFAACDAQNLERVPGFLRRMLDPAAAAAPFSSMLLTTHLDALARSATLRIPIVPDPGTRLSHINWSK